MDPPAFNSMYFYCDSSACNSKEFEHPGIVKRELQVNLNPKKKDNENQSMNLRSKNKFSKRSFATTITISVEEILIALHLSYYITQLF